MDIASRVRDLLIARAKSHGYVHERGAHAGKVNESSLARLLGISQPTLHRVLTGEINKPSPALLRAMTEKLGIFPGEIMGPSAGAVSAEAVALAARIAALPPHVRKLFEQQVTAYERLVNDSPHLAGLLLSAVKGDYLAHEKRMETVSSNIRAGSSHAARRGK